MIKKIIIVLSTFLALVLAVFFYSNPLTGQEQSETLRFIGRFHPVLLHLPIGFFVVLGVLELGSLFPPFFRLKASIPIILVLTILATLLAVFTGMMLAYASGSNEPLVILHMRASLILAILTLALGVFKLRGHKAAWATAYRITLVAAYGFLIAASHNGGSITHGEDYLTQYMPNSLRPLFGLEVVEKKVVASVEDLVVFADLVHPIFEQNCNTCHNPNKKKGELNMETYEGLLAGGDSGYSIAPGDRDDSELFFRITLPHDDEDFMPTDGKPPLSETEVEVIGWWIQEGADPIRTVGEYTGIPATIDAYFHRAFQSMVSEEELEAREQKRRDLYARLAEIRAQLGILIIPIEPRASRFSVETFAVAKSFDNQALAKLKPFADSIVEADFSNTRLTDESFQTLVEFKNLQALNLSNTPIQGSEIERLSQLKNLKSLNLYGTALGKEQIGDLSKLTQLKNLYLFQTELYDDSAIAQLRAALPDCDLGIN